MSAETFIYRSTKTNALFILVTKTGMLSSFRVSLRFAYKLKKKQNKIKDFQAEFIAHAFAGWWTRVHRIMIAYFW